MILFRPAPDGSGSNSEGQLMMMVNLLGRIPEEMMTEGKHVPKYFDSDGMIPDGLAHC